MTNRQNKLFHLIRLLGYMLKGRELYAQDATLIDELDVDERTLRRYLEEIQDNFSDVILFEKKNKELGGRKVSVYRIIDMHKDLADILSFYVNNNASGIGWLMQLIYENDPQVLKGLDEEQKKSLQSHAAKNSDAIIFRSNPLENMIAVETENKLKVLKNAVKEYEYKTIHYTYQNAEILEDVKCLKILFMKNNWYLAVETEEKNFRLLRIAFIDSIKYSKKSNYQKSVLDEYGDFFATIQNPMSLPFARKRTAILKAKGRIAIYFEESMKKFFDTQQFIRKEEDGVVFSIDYTQPLEILPFVKEWIPDMIILEPSDLKDVLTEDLSNYLKSI